MDWLTGYYLGANPVLSAAKAVLLLRGLRSLSAVKKVWTVHNLYHHDRGPTAYERGVVRQVVRHCDGLTFHSHAALDRFAAEFDISGTAKAVIPHGHYIDAYPSSTTRKEARALLGISEEARVVLFFGRLRPYKGIEDLIDAFASVRSEEDVLIVAGLPFPNYPAEELQKQAMQAGIHRFIFEPRHVKDVELQEFFHACDVVALPFRSVLNSGSAVLAMSFGCPIVAPEVGSLPEVVPARAYYGYEPRHRSGLRDALDAALSGTRLPRQDVIDHCRRTLAWDEIAAKAVSFYSTL